MDTFLKINDEMRQCHDSQQAQHLAKFFKTGKGEYGEGDKFLGIKVPVTRSFVRKYRDVTVLEDVDSLISSEWHEIRLAGFLLLVELYRKSISDNNFREAKNLVDYYVSNISKGNNWDLVDLIAYKILGDWVTIFPTDKKIMEDLSDKAGFLWHQRVSIVSTLALIRCGNYEMTFKIAEKFLNHPHDLIRKATGWMLRETGKKGGIDLLKDFLKRHKQTMSRTTLRYAIEKFPYSERKQFMAR